MNTWEDRRRKSWSYYACLLLLLSPPILILSEMFLTTMFLGVDAVVPFFLFAVVVIVLVFGLGVRYRYRGINPASRNIINATDGHYFERIGADESDYP
ncbi:MAG: hypothetical protein C4K48_06350 [Candidatus Thorarchaeota archaeon]|nr:MAG: hypothetical protein C4K48_06350 [Candidatus Thorarchaeota archaeon]